jgi:hypothetical protein
MLALRPPSRGKQTLKGTVTVEAMPLDALHIEGARAHQGAHRLDQKSFVLFPSGGVLSEWRKDSKIEFLPIEKAVPASIDFYLAIKRDGPKATSASLALPVVVPPVPREDPTLPLELTALVLAEGVKLLVRDGWDFVKGQISRVTGKEPDIIQLHIGDLTLGPETATDDAIDQATKSVSVSVSNASVEEVSGLNRRLQTLFIRKKHLLSNVDRAATTIDKSNALAEIDHTDRDIKEVKDKLWLALEAAGVLSVSGQA